LFLTGAAYHYFSGLFYGNMWGLTHSNTMRLFAFFFALTAILGCGQTAKSRSAVKPDRIDSTPVISASIGQIPAPPGYKRIAGEDGSFAEWLRKVPLKKGKQVYLYNGSLKPNQSAQFAVVDIPVGDKDLQQCADVVMRLRAEYLFASKLFAAIRFNDYSGKWYNWEGAENRPRFDQYLQQVFAWCGSASLEKQMKPVENFDSIAPGDVLVKGGFPGHAMMIADMAVNDKGNKIFLLVQGYQPAQDIHIVINPRYPDLSPWYEANAPGLVTTPEWIFKKEELRRW